jgi:hypothetical protein
MASSHGQPRCCGHFWGGEVQARLSSAQRQVELNFYMFHVEASGLSALEVNNVESCGCHGDFKEADGALENIPGHRALAGRACVAVRVARWPIWSEKTQKVVRFHEGDGLVSLILEEGCNKF